MNDNHALDALNRARSSTSIMNYAAILSGFASMGIPPSEVIPRENVLTFNAWRALNRTVRKGEHGIKVITWIEFEKDGQTHKRPSSTTVFHVTQTEPMKEAI